MIKKDVKVATTIREQICILKKRGLLISDEVFAEEVLRNISYYRFIGYTLSCKVDDIFNPGTTFENIYSLYLFDKKLRSILISLLEDIEISFRSQIAHHHLIKYGPLGYKDPSNFKCLENHISFINKLYQSIHQNKKEVFLRHNINKYKDIAFWVAIETLTFGNLAKLFSNLKDKDQKSICKNYTTIHYRDVSSWLINLSNVRNMCAHYGRIYNRKFNLGIGTRGIDAHIINDKIFPRIFIMKKLSSKDSWELFYNNLEPLINEYSDKIDLNLIGFPDNWQSILNV